MLCNAVKIINLKHHNLKNQKKCPYFKNELYGSKTIDCQYKLEKLCNFLLLTLPTFRQKNWSFSALEQGIEPDGFQRYSMYIVSN